MAVERPDEDEVARTLAVLAAEVVDAPDELGVEPDAGAEGEAAAVDAPERDALLALRSGPARAAHATGSRGSPSARESTLVPPPGDEAHGHVGLEAVHDLVEGAVAAEDVDALVGVRRRRRQLGGVSGASVSSVSTASPAAASARSTATVSSGVTRDAIGLTMRALRTPPL